MATKTIPQLPAAAAALTTMLFEVDDAGTSEKVSQAQVITLLDPLYRTTSFPAAAAALTTTLLNSNNAGTQEKLSIAQVITLLDPLYRTTSFAASAAALTTTLINTNNAGTQEKLTIAQLITLLNTLYAPVATVGFVSGQIIMWSGTIATIPSGFVLCNGSNSTPDLRNRFVVCANADSGGLAKTTVTGSAQQSASPTHTHSQGSLSNSLGGGADFSEVAPTDSYIISGTTGTTTSGTGANATVPTFFALAYIMKT